MDDMAVDSDEEVDYSKMDQVCYELFVVQEYMLLADTEALCLLESLVFARVRLWLSGIRRPWAQPLASPVKRSRQRNESHLPKTLESHCHSG